MTTREDASPNVLQKLDHRPATSFYWSLTLLATLGRFLFGYDTSNIGSALNFVPYHLTGFAQGYLVAGASLGAAVGALAAGRLSDRVGRKSCWSPTWRWPGRNNAAEPSGAAIMPARSMA